LKKCGNRGEKRKNERKEIRDLGISNDEGVNSKDDKNGKIIWDFADIYPEVVVTLTNPPIDQY
jgi:hypothetical protein